MLSAKHRGVRQRCRTSLQDRKLISAEAGQQAILLDQRLNAPCCNAKDIVSCGVAIDVIDLLEPVEVDGIERAWLCSGYGFLFNFPQETKTACRTRKRIKICLALDDGHGGDAFRCILDRSFDENRISLGIPDIPGILRDPDFFPRAVAIDLRDKILDPAFHAHQALELVAAPGVHIPGAVGARHRMDIFGFVLVAIKHGKRRVAAHRRAVQLVAVNAANRVFKEAPVFGLRHAVGAGLLMAEINILDDDNNLVFSHAPGMKPGETAGGNLVKLDVLILVAAQDPEPGNLRRNFRGFKGWFSGQFGKLRMSRAIAIMDNHAAVCGDADDAMARSFKSLARAHPVCAAKLFATRSNRLPMPPC